MTKKPPDGNRREYHTDFPTFTPEKRQQDNDDVSWFASLLLGKTLRKPRTKPLPPTSTVRDGPKRGD